MDGEWVADGSQSTWNAFGRPGAEGETIHVRSLVKTDDGPSVTHLRQPRNHPLPHFHDGATCKVVVKGAVRVGRSWRQAPAVHYVDAGVPYTFWTDEDFEII